MLLPTTLCALFGRSRVNDELELVYRPFLVLSERTIHLDRLREVDVLWIDKFPHPRLWIADESNDREFEVWFWHRRGLAELARVLIARQQEQPSAFTSRAAKRLPRLVHPRED